MATKMALKDAWANPELLFQLLGEGKPVLVDTGKETILLRGSLVAYASTSEKYITIGYGQGFEVLLTRNGYLLNQY